MVSTRCKLALVAAVAFVVTGCKSTPTPTEHDLTKSGAIKEAENVQYTQENVWIVQPGYFKENFERLSLEAGYSTVVWDRRVRECIWEQPTGFIIPRNDAKEALAFYARTQDFYLHFSQLDMHVRLEYKGPSQRLRHCD